MKSRQVLFAILISGAFGAQAAEAPRKTASGSPATPNVLFIAVDDLRSWLGVYGHPQVRTPHLDALAASGVRFDSAYSQAAVCMPSRTSILSGCRPDEAGEQWLIGRKSARSIRTVRPDITSLPEHLRTHGWHTVSIGKIGHDWDTDGFDEMRLGPAERELGYFQLPGSRAKIADKSLKLPARGIPFEAADLPETDFNDGKVAADAVRTLKTLKAAGKPFFLGVGFWRPHMPLVVPKKYWDMYPPESIALPQNLAPPAGVGPLARFSGPSQINWSNYRLPEQKDGTLDERNMREMIRGYLAAITFVDAQIGLVLAALEDEGLAGNTIVIFWSDQGYHLGEHGEWSKLTCYEESTHIPLLIRDPAAPHAGSVVAPPVEALDLYPTLCDLLDLPRPAHLEGESLVPLLRGEPGRKNDSAITLVHRPSAVGWSLRTATHRYTVWFDKKTQQPVQRELFDRRTDPGENQNLSADPEHAALMQTLHDRLMRQAIEPQRAALKPNHKN